MSIINNRIQAPVSMEDIRTLLKEEVTDLHSLCSSSKIASMSKYKPVIVDSPITTDSTWKASQDITNDCGFSIPVRTINSSKLYTLIDDLNLNDLTGEGKWIYNKPSSKNWCRLADFEGYLHTPTPMFNNSTKEISITEGQSTISVLTGRNMVCIDGSLTVDMLESLKNKGIKYYGAFLYGYNGGKRYYKRVVSNVSCFSTTSALGHTSSCTFTFDTSDLPAGNYQIYYFLADTPLSFNSSDIEISIVPLYKVVFTSLVINKPDGGEDLITLSSLFAKLTKGILSPQVKITNNSNNKIQIRNAVFTYYPKGSLYEGYSATGLNVEIDAKTSLQYDGGMMWDVGSIESNSSRTIKFTCEAGGKSYSISGNVIEGLIPSPW